MLNSGMILNSEGDWANVAVLDCSIMDIVGEESDAIVPANDGTDDGKYDASSPMWLMEPMASLMRTTELTVMETMAQIVFHRRP